MASLVPASGTCGRSWKSAALTCSPRMHVFCNSESRGWPAAALCGSAMTDDVMHTGVVSLQVHGRGSTARLACG